jgi:SAM-dependent methyltransferase
MTVDTDRDPQRDRRVDSKWQAPGAGARYEGQRWRSTRSRDRDPRMVARLLNRFSVPTTGHGALDVPCGSGRLRATLVESGFTATGLDVSAAMLASQGPDRPVPGSVWRLPFRDHTFDVVVCCRLLHHLKEESQIATALNELVRVSRDLVIASFWSSASFHAWRRRHGMRRSRRPDARFAVSKTRLSSLVCEAGADVVGYEHSFRFVSQQTFLAARKRATVRP